MIQNQLCLVPFCSRIVPQLAIGDVVTVTLSSDNKVIGIICEIHGETFSVQVSRTEVIENVAKENVHRIAPWNEIEPGDIVKVKEEGSTLYYEANILSRNEDGTFRVSFGDHIEDNIALDRIVKVMSGRLEQSERMMMKE